LPIDFKAVNVITRLIVNRQEGQAQMSTLKNPHIIEAIVEIRWGKINKIANPANFEFTPDDTDFFLGSFRDIARKNGFENVEPLLPKGVPHFPHLPMYRFRQAPQKWPCYQMGLGIFTINQVRHDYDWITFKKAIIKGLKMVDLAHPKKLAGLPALGISLTYQDGFLLNGTHSTDFLQRNFDLGLHLPAELLNAKSIENPAFNLSISSSLVCSKPGGILNISVQEALINKEPGIVMNTSIISSDGNKPEFTVENLSKWLEDAHKTNLFAFKKILKTEYLETLK